MTPPPDLSALTVVHRTTSRTVRMVLTAEGVAEISEQAGTADDHVQLVIEQPDLVDRGQAPDAWTAERLASSTRLVVGSLNGLSPWGLPPESSVARTAPDQRVLRFHCAGSPFAGRPLAVDLVGHGQRLLTRVAQGAADLHVRSDWDPMCAWLTRPELLFSDAFPELIGLHGDLALLSMFEGLLWEVTAPRPRVDQTVLRWARWWASVPVRDDLARAGLAPWP